MAQGFTIRWDPSYGGYRVSVPQLSPDGERVHVVRREDFDRVAAERDALQARIDAAYADLDEVWLRNVPERQAERVKRARAILSGEDVE